MRCIPLIHLNVLLSPPLNLSLALPPTVLPTTQVSFLSLLSSLFYFMQLLIYLFADTNPKVGCQAYNKTATPNLSTMCPPFMAKEVILTFTLLPPYSTTLSLLPYHPSFTYLLFIFCFFIVCPLLLIDIQVFVPNIPSIQTIIDSQLAPQIAPIKVLLIVLLSPHPPTHSQSSTFTHPPTTPSLSPHLHTY